MHEIERSQSLTSERAILIRVILPDQTVEDDPLEELRGLATTAQAEVVMGVTQRRSRPDVRTYVGKGKLEELALQVDAREVDVVNTLWL